MVQALLFDASKPSDSIKPWNRGTADDSKYNRTVAYFSIVRPVFPLKTGDLMFVGFDSQNTFHSFPHYPNGILWVWGILLIGFREWSGDSNSSFTELLCWSVENDLTSRAGSIIFCNSSFTLGTQPCTNQGLYCLSQNCNTKEKENNTHPETVKVIL